MALGGKLSSSNFANLLTRALKDWTKTFSFANMHFHCWLRKRVFTTKQDVCGRLFSRNLRVQAFVNKGAQYDYNECINDSTRCVNNNVESDFVTSPMISRFLHTFKLLNRFQKRLTRKSFVAIYSRSPSFFSLPERKIPVKRIAEYVQKLKWKWVATTAIIFCRQTMTKIVCALFMQGWWKKNYRECLTFSGQLNVWFSLKFCNFYFPHGYFLCHLETEIFYQLPMPHSALLPNKKR